MRVLLSFLLFLVSVDAKAINPPPPFSPRNAESCTSIDARSANPALAQHWATPRDQDGIGWCYSYAAADVLTAALGKPISATDLAYSYNLSVEDDTLTYVLKTVFFLNGQEDFQGGWSSEVLRLSQINGVCPESVLPSNGYFTSAQGDSVLKAVQVLQEMRDRIQVNQLSQRAFIDCIHCQARLAEAGFQSLFPNMPLETIYQAIQNVNEGQINRVLFSLAQTYCRNNRILPPQNMQVRAETRHSRGAYNTFPTIDRILASGGLVAITGSSQMYGVQFNGIHATAIVARQFRNGRCQYLVRNSWGRSCASYNHPDLLKEDCNASSGTIWMNEAHISHYVDRIDYVEMQ